MTQPSVSAVPPEAARFPGRRRIATVRGLTLVEVMLAMVVLGLAALAGLSAMLFSYRTSDANLRALAALTAARTIAEQISTLDFDTLSGSSLPVDLPSSAIGTMTVNAWNERTDDVHGTSAQPEDDLVLSIRPEITLSDPTTLFSCAQVVVRYRWQETTFFTPRTREDALTFVLSPAESY